MIGETISRYLVVDKLGEGGMGVVYNAQDTRLGRFVALKLLPDNFASDPHVRRPLLGRGPRRVGTEPPQHLHGV